MKWFSYHYHLCNIIMFCSFRSYLKSLAAVKKTEVTSLSTDWENCKINLYGKSVYYVISPNYIIKEIEKFLVCLYCVITGIIHSANVKRIILKIVIMHHLAGIPYRPTIYFCYSRHFNVFNKTFRKYSFGF